MKSIRTLACLFYLALPAIASSADSLNPFYSGPYISLGAGFSRITDPSLFKDREASNSQRIKFSPAPVFNAHLGYKINRFFRTDINAQFRIINIKSPADLKPIKLTNYVAMLNGYLDLNYFNSFVPYLTAGFGGSSLHVKKDRNSNTAIRSSDSAGAAFAFGGGTQILFNETFGADLAYKYVDLGKLKVTDSAAIAKSPNIGTHELLLNILIIL